MKQAIALACALGLSGLCGTSSAQQDSVSEALISTWTLTAVERNIRSDEPTVQRGARGVLIMDRSGHVFEFFSTASRDEPESPQADPLRAFENFGGFWGRYEVDETGDRISFDAYSGVSPSVRGRSFTRTFEVDGDWLTVTSGDEPQAQGNTRWTWQRIPTVEHLTPAYREVVGFWQHVEERRVDQATGEVLSSSERAPSVIVYTPGGFVGVHFPSLGREPFAGPVPTADEARAGLRGYIGYFGTLGVYPGEVSHNVLSGVSPGTGSILRRYARISGDELVVTLQSGMPALTGDDRPRTATEVVLHRLSDADDMLPMPN